MRTRSSFGAGILAVSCVIASVASCSSSSTIASKDAGPTGPAGVFVPPQDPGPGGILFAASGEALALTGYAFPPKNDGDPAFVDGWDVSFTRLLVTVDKITLSENPDSVVGDQSQEGSTVAEVDGPWAIDLAHADPAYLPGKGGPGEEAVPIAALSSQNKNGGNSFKTDGTRYAFGFSTIAASTSALNVNMDAAAQADYQTMVQKGCTVLYVGTATFKGGTVTGYEDCNSAAVYAQWPKAVNFSLCYKSPTDYINCQNPDNDPAKALAGEEHERGIAFLSDKSVIGQVTIHTDHPFWDSVLHDSPAHFDQFAARAAGMGVSASSDGGTEGGAEAGPSTIAIPTVTLESQKGVDYTSVVDALGATLKWRYCMDPPTDVHAKLSGIMSFDAQGVTGLTDYEDFSTYNQSTQGHLNSDGLCFVKRNYASPK